jgi:pantothenate synthetase
MAHHSGHDALGAARAVLAAEHGIDVDYVEVANWGAPTLVAAVRVGTTRLIDNVALA